MSYRECDGVSEVTDEAMESDAAALARWCMVEARFCQIEQRHSLRMLQPKLVKILYAGVVME